MKDKILVFYVMEERRVHSMVGYGRRVVYELIVSVREGCEFYLEICCKCYKMCQSGKN